MWITWKHQDTELSWPLKIEQKIDLFYEQALGWQLHIADLVANGGTAFGEEGRREGHAVSAIRHSGFAVLQICLSYFETIGHYTGTPHGSKAAFQAGVKRVFPDLANADPENAARFIDALYKDVRCGLYHNVRTASVGLGWPPGESTAAYVGGHVVLSPERLPKALKAHLETFRQELLDPENRELRERFEAKFNEDAGIT